MKYFSEISHNSGFIILRWRGFDGHHWLLHPGQAGAWLGLGESQGGQDHRQEHQHHGHHPSVLDGLGSGGNMASDILIWYNWQIFLIVGLRYFQISGLCVQSCCTGRGTHHQESLPQVKYSKHDLTETREERKQRKYRYLYQVRMCHGDVISSVNRPIQGKYVQHLDDGAYHWDTCSSWNPTNLWNLSWQTKNI